MEEVDATMKQLLAGKSPSVDSIHAEFYHEMWEDIAADIFNFVQESITQCFLLDN